MKEHIGRFRIWPVNLAILNGMQVDVQGKKNCSIIKISVHPVDLFDQNVVYALSLNILNHPVVFFSSGTTSRVNIDINALEIFLYEYYVIGDELLLSVERVTFCLLFLLRNTNVSER
ncbi:hypothetical protein L0222_14315 [bacterium]|nr:hypothetical protein [bacterium]